MADLKIKRLFDAPVEKVWMAWTNPALMKKWWGPKGFTAPHVSIDLREGGKYLSCMRGRAGPGMPVQDFWSTGIYLKISPMKKIVATDNFADKKGNIVPASYYGMEGDFAAEMLLTVKFENSRGKTRLIIKHSGHPKSMVDLAAQGWNQSLDKLEEVIEGKRVSLEEPRLKGIAY